MITALGGSFTIWKVYLNPLKERVIVVEKKFERMEERIGGIDERTMGLIRMREDLVKMQRDIEWIKNNCKVCKQ